MERHNSHVPSQLQNTVPYGVTKEQTLAFILMIQLSSLISAWYMYVHTQNVNML